MTREPVSHGHRANPLYPLTPAAAAAVAEECRISSTPPSTTTVYGCRHMRVIIINIAARGCCFCCEFPSFISLNLLLSKYTIIIIIIILLNERI